MKEKIKLKDIFNRNLVLILIIQVLSDSSNNWASAFINMGATAAGVSVGAIGIGASVYTISALITRMPAGTIADSDKKRIGLIAACIACPREEEDPHLTRASLLFHEKLGFRTWGHAERCAFKFDRWYDMVWMGKAIGTPLTPPAPFLPFPEIREKT